MLCGPEDDGQEQYILQALIVHQGGAVGGHYYLYSRTCGQRVYTKAELLNDSEFVELNDAKSREISTEAALSCIDGAKSAYILAYIPLTEYTMEENKRKQLRELLQQ